MHEEQPPENFDQTGGNVQPHSPSVSGQVWFRSLSCDFHACQQNGCPCFSWCRDSENSLFFSWQAGRGVLPVTAISTLVEFQARGLPHVHIFIGSTEIP
jgi:hypothetical protein